MGRGTFVRDGAPARASAAPSSRCSSPLVDRLLDFERARVRYAAPAGTVPLHSLVPDPSLYPVDEFRRALNRVLARRRQRAAALRRAAGRRRPARGARRAAARHRHGRRPPTRSRSRRARARASCLALRLFAGARATRSRSRSRPTTTCSRSLAALGLRAAPVPMRDGAPDLAALERVLERARREGVLHDAHLPQPARHDARRSSTGARCSRSRRGRRQAGDRGRLRDGSALRGPAAAAARGARRARASWCSSSRSRSRCSRARASARSRRAVAPSTRCWR